MAETADQDPTRSILAIISSSALGNQQGRPFTICCSSIPLSDKALLVQISTGMSALNVVLAPACLLSPWQTWLRFATQFCPHAWRVFPCHWLVQLGGHLKSRAAEVPVLQHTGV